MIRNTLAIALLVILTSGLATAQGPTAKVPQDSTAQAYTARVYTTKWRTAGEMVEVLDILIQQGARISASEAFNTLSVYASPEVHDIVTDLLAKYDKPAPQFELRFYILRAETGGSGSSPDIPEPIQGILKEISEVTRYDSFQAIDSPVMRLTAGRRARVSGGAAMTYTIEIGLNSVISQGEKALLRVDKFGFVFRVPTGSYVTSEGVPRTLYQTAQIETSFSIADGESVVLGTSQLRDGNAEEGFSVIAIVHARMIE